MIQWIQKMTDENLLDNWNVVLTGVNKDKSNSNLWKVNEDIGIYKVTRSQKSKNKVDDENLIVFSSSFNNEK